MLIGLLRIKNEARWIAHVVQSIQPVCGRILIFDDHSTDGTPEICESRGCRVFRSPFLADPNNAVAKDGETLRRVDEFLTSPGYLKGKPALPYNAWFESCPGLNGGFRLDVLSTPPRFLWSRGWRRRRVSTAGGSATKIYFKPDRRGWLFPFSSVFTGGTAGAGTARVVS